MRLSNHYSERTKDHCEKINQQAEIRIGYFLSAELLHYLRGSSKS
jgi:hypothetical protein